MSTSDDLADAGFSPSTDQVNLLTQPGVINAPEQSTDVSTNLTASLIASCEDPTGSYDRLALSSSPPDGQFYSYTSSAFTTRGSLDSSHQYTQGKTDMIAFDGECYATSASHLVRWSAIGSSNTFNFTFFAFTNDGTTTAKSVPHPALNYNNFAYYGDGNLLRRQSGAGVTPVTILSLPVGWVIVALGIDPGSGLMLISVIGQVNLSGIVNSGAKVIFYNGSSSTYQRIVAVDDMVTAFTATEGALYAAYGPNLGLWNGSGITFLRKVAVTADFLKLLYKQHFTSIGSTLFYIENHKIMAYGPVEQRGRNVFYPALANTPSGVATNLTHIMFIGGASGTTQRNIIYSYDTAKAQLWNFNGVSSNATMDVYSNKYLFDNEMWIYWIRVVWKNGVSSGADPGSLRLRNQDGAITETNPTFSGLLDLKNTSGATTAIKVLDFNAIKVTELQLELLNDTVVAGIRRVIVYGEEADRPKT